MPTNHSQFTAAIHKAVKKIPAEQIVPFHKKVHLELLSRIVFKTPVRTGRARGSWQTTLGAPPISDVQLVDPITEGLTRLANLEPFTTSYIGSNVNYILPLEEGSSKRAPQGMVRVSLEELRSIFP